MLNNIVALLGNGAGGGGGSYESIATATGTGSSGTITFSSIPSTYKHLQIRGISKSTDTVGTGLVSYRITANGVGGTSYARHILRGDGATAGAAGGASAAYIDTYGGIPTSSTGTTSMMGAIVLDIIDYADTTKNKTFRLMAGADKNGSGTVELTSGLFASTAAISSISLALPSNSWTTATTFALYGIKG